jgi:hypothetical protein
MGLKRKNKIEWRFKEIGSLVILIQTDKTKVVDKMVCEPLLP